MRGLATFVAWTVLAAIFCAALFLGLAALFFGQSPEGLFEAVGAGRTDAIVTLLAFIFGTAATVAGAIATVYVSNLALRLSQDAERRETMRFAAERLDEGVSHVTAIVAAINEIYAIADHLLPKLDRFADGYSVPMHQLRDTDFQKLREAQGRSAQFAADSLERLGRALEEAGGDDFTRFALAQQSKDMAVPNVPPEAREALLRLKDLASTPARLRLAALELRGNLAWRLTDARLMADSAVPVEEGDEQARAARTLVFAGALIDSWSERDAGGAPHKMFVSGALFLADLVAAMPNGAALVAALKEKYPGVAPAKFQYPATFDAQGAFSPPLLRAIAGAKAMHALSYLRAAPTPPAEG